MRRGEGESPRGSTRRPVLMLRGSLTFLSPTLSFTIDSILSGGGTDGFQGRRVGQVNNWLIFPAYQHLKNDQHSKYSMHQGHVSRPVSSDPPAPHPINDIILTLRVSSSVRSSVSSLPLAIQMGPVPFDPSSSAQWEGTTQSMQLCPKDSGPVSPLPVCRIHNRGGEGGKLKVKPVLETLLHSSWMLTMYTEKTAWQSWAELLPLWVDTGRQHAALHRKPLLHMQVIRFHKQLFPWFIYFFFLEYLYSFLNL